MKLPLLKFFPCMNVNLELLTGLVMKGKVKKFNPNAYSGRLYQLITAFFRVYYPIPENLHILGVPSREGCSADYSDECSSLHKVRATDEPTGFS